MSIMLFFVVGSKNDVIDEDNKMLMNYLVEEYGVGGGDTNC
jgi:hypothetical protein